MSLDVTKAKGRWPGWGRLLLLTVAALTAIGLWFFTFRAGAPTEAPPVREPATQPSSAPTSTSSSTTTLPRLPPPSISPPVPVPATQPSSTPTSTYPRLPPTSTITLPPTTTPLSPPTPTPGPTTNIHAATLPPDIVTRSGGRQVAALRDQAYYVLYEPQPDLQLGRFGSALGSRTFGFEVLSFERLPSEPISRGFHVERAGEIVSSAIALQLERMGFRVGIELDRALDPLREQLGQRFKIDLSRVSLRAKFSGTVKFVVLHRERSATQYETRAELDVAVVVTGADGTALYRRSLNEGALETASSLEGHAERGRSTATTAVRLFIRHLFADPTLEQSLVLYVAKN